MTAQRQKFDGYAAQYDEWFMTNYNLFASELRLFQKVLGDRTTTSPYAPRLPKLSHTWSICWAG